MLENLARKNLRKDLSIKLKRPIIQSAVKFDFGMKFQDRRL